MTESLNKVQLIGEENGVEDIVDPWNVTSKSQTGIDYDKLICK